MVGVLSAKHKASQYHHPRFSSISSNCINKQTKPQPNQHFAFNNVRTGENLKMSQAFSNNLNSFNTGNTYNYITPDDESKILAWLSPLEPGVRHRDIGAQRVDSIGYWLLETQEFRRWHGGNQEDGSTHPTLFCHGNPGAGKSYIM